MLDTGAQANVIKRGCINNNVRINNKEIIQLTGITEDVVNTLGTTVANIYNVPVIFHVVPDEFPIITQGILGSSFFNEQNACINYANKFITWHDCAFPFKNQETVVIPARTNMGVTIRIANPGIKTGHCPPLKGPEGVYSGDCLVTCINDKAYIRFINTLDYEVEIAIPIITLNEISQVAQKPPQYKNNSELRNTQITENPLSANPAKTHTVLPKEENKEQLVNSLQANKDQNIQN